MKIETWKTGVSPARGSRILFLLAFLGFLHVSGATVFAQQKEVELKIDVRQKSFRVGEPVIVQQTLVNLGGEPVSFAELSHVSQTMQYWIVPEKGAPRQLESNRLRDPSGLLKLSPGESHRGEQLIHFDYAAGELAFPTPGKYRLKAAYVGYISAKTPPGPAEISLEIVEPAPEDKEPAELFRQGEIADFLNNATRSPEIVRKLASLVERFPKSLFSLYGRYYLALHHMRQYHDKPSDMEAAVQLMGEAAETAWQLQPRALIHMGEWLWRLGDPERSFAYFDQVGQKFSGTVFAETAQSLKKRLSALTPPAPAPKKAPLKPELETAVLQSLDRYFSAFEKKDLDGCLRQLDEGFRYNDALDKKALAAQLKEDFEKLKGKGGIFKVRREVEKLETIDGSPEARLKLSYLSGQELLSPPVRVRISFVQKNENWLFLSWKTLGK